MIDKSKYFIEKIILKFKSSIGLIEFRYITFKDNYFFQKLDKSLSDKDFSVRAIFNQLETNIDFDKFSTISEQELKDIIDVYVKKSNSIYNHYSKMDSEDIFLKFKKSILLYLDEQRKRMEAIGKLITQQFESTRRIIEQSIALPKLIPNMILPKIVFPKIEIPKLILPDFSRQLKILDTSFFKIFQKQSNLWQTFAVQYKKISKKSLRNLKKYSWFINESMPATFIAETAKMKNAKDMKELFIFYHTYDNCKTLDVYFSEWKKNPLFKKRMKLLYDAITLFRKNYGNKNLNINNIVIPVLINQIEGLRQDYLKSKGLIHVGKNSWQDPKTKKTVKWTDLFNDALKSEDEFTKLTFNIFSNILFQQDNKKTSIINFSRHKISHGLNTKYGTIETTIRCFMILEFISDLK